jgi:hypothetical protein
MGGSLFSEGRWPWPGRVGSARRAGGGDAALAFRSVARREGLCARDRLLHLSRWSRAHSTTSLAHDHRRFASRSSLPATLPSSFTTALEPPPHSFLRTSWTSTLRRPPGCPRPKRARPRPPPSRSSASSRPPTTRSWSSCLSPSCPQGRAADRAVLCLVRLWHNLTIALLRYIKLPETGPQQVEMFTSCVVAGAQAVPRRVTLTDPREFRPSSRFVRDFERKLNPLRLVEMGRLVARQIEGPSRCCPARTAELDADRARDSQTPLPRSRSSLPFTRDCRILTRHPTPRRLSQRRRRHHRRPRPTRCRSRPLRTASCCWAT